MRSRRPDAGRRAVARGGERGRSERARPSRPRSERSGAERRVTARLRDRARRGTGSGPSAVLTTRAAVLGLVVCALVVSAALPLREFLTQRGRIETLAQEQTERRERVAALETERRLLDDPAHVTRLARERLHYERPGETTYVVVDPDASGALPGRPAPAAPGGSGPWYDRLLTGLRDADAQLP